MAKKPKAKHEAVATGEVWRPKGDGDSPHATWMVVSISENGLIGLSGPGPCRSYKTMLDEEFLRDWERVSEGRKP